MGILTAPCVFLGAQIYVPAVECRSFYCELKPGGFGDSGEMQREKEALPVLRGFGGSGWPGISPVDKVGQQSVKKGILA